jgi:hypothetical protein
LRTVLANKGANLDHIRLEKKDGRWFLVVKALKVQPKGDEQQPLVDLRIPLPTDTEFPVRDFIVDYLFIAIETLGRTRASTVRFWAHKNSARYADGCARCPRVVATVPGCQADCLGTVIVGQRFSWYCTKFVVAQQWRALVVP